MTCLLVTVTEKRQPGTTGVLIRPRQRLVCTRVESRTIISDLGCVRRRRSNQAAIALGSLALVEVLEIAGRVRSSRDEAECL
eukprot:scaffold97635_cov60-Phaeocystis_antarctica.AAC.2